MALVDYETIYSYNNPEDSDPEAFTIPTFKECVAADITAAFFNGTEHAEMHKVNGKDCLVIMEEEELRGHDSHREAGAKQNYDTGLYNAHVILYIKVEDYGMKPQIGKELVMDAGTKDKISYRILKCDEEDGIYRIVMERVRQNGGKSNIQW